MIQPDAVREEIERRAYQLWEKRGRPWGTPETDWLRAEQEFGDGAQGGVLSKVAREVGTVLGHAVAFMADLDPRKQEPS